MVFLQQRVQIAGANISTRSRANKNPRRDCAQKHEGSFEATWEEPHLVPGRETLGKWSSRGTFNVSSQGDGLGQVNQTCASLWLTSLWPETWWCSLQACEHICHGKTNLLPGHAHMRVHTHAATLMHMPASQRQSRDTIIPEVEGKKVPWYYLPKLSNDGVRYSEHMQHVVFLNRTSVWIPWIAAGLKFESTPHPTPIMYSHGHQAPPLQLCSIS